MTFAGLVGRCLSYRFASNVITKVIYASSSDSSDYSAQLLSEKGSLWRKPNDVGKSKEEAATKCQAAASRWAGAPATPLDSRTPTRRATKQRTLIEIYNFNEAATEATAANNTHKTIFPHCETNKQTNREKSK